MLLTDAEDALDKVISKGRVHLYKPTLVPPKRLDLLDAHRDMTHNYERMKVNDVFGIASSTCCPYRLVPSHYTCIPTSTWRVQC